VANTTSRYRFEYRIQDWASSWSTQLVGHRVAFFVAFRRDGSVRRVYVAPVDRPFDGAQKAALGQEYATWFLYLPYDSEGTAYLEWLNLPRATIERWIGRTLLSDDFLDVRATGCRDDWPESWRVIVG
jgi:hypothetical protein